MTQAVLAAGSLAQLLCVRRRCSLGMTAHAWWAAKPADIHYATDRCELGGSVVALSDRGICAVLLGDDDATLLTELRREPRLPTSTAADASSERPFKPLSPV
ncbi:hypothetical protein ACNKHQ_13205 [Shigella flexneri]